MKKLLLRLLGASIIIFWLTMMVLLVRKEIFLPSLLPRKIKMLSYEKVRSRDSWFGIYFKNNKIGYSHIKFSKYMDKKTAKPKYTLENQTYMRVGMLGEKYEINISGSSRLDEKFHIDDFEFLMFLGGNKIKISGKRSAELMSITLTSKSNTIRKAIQVDRDIVPLDIISIIIDENVKVKRTYTAKVFDPVTLGTGKAVIKVEKDDESSEEKTYKLKTSFRGLETVSWISNKRGLLREENPMGWVMIKEPKLKAKDMRLAKESMDMVSVYSIKSNVDIKDPRKARYLKVKLKGVNLKNFNLETNRQKIVDKNILEIRVENIKNTKIASRPILEKKYAEFLKDTLFIQSENRKIKKEALKIVDGENNAWQGAKKIVNWVNKNLKKFPTVSIPSAVDVFARREGDCNEHAILTCAFARSCGIPSVICAGIVYQEGRFYYHAWCKMYVGEWVSMDPVFGQYIADAAHIEFSSGDSIDAQLEIMKLIGKLEIEVLKYD